MKCIVRIVTGNDDGGVLTSEAMYVSRLRERGFDVLGIIIGGGESLKIYKDLFQKFYEVNELPKFDGTVWRKLLNAPGTIAHAQRESARVLKYFGSNTENLIITAQQQPTLLFSALVARALNKTLYWHAPGPMKGRLQKVFLRVTKGICQVEIIANSAYTARQLGVSASKIVYPGFDSNRIKSTESGKYRRLLGVPDGAALYTVVARFHKEKASDLVVKSFIGSRPFHEGAHLVMAGRSRSNEFYRQLSEQVQIHGEGRIHLLDFVEDAGNLIGDADVVINGRRDAEPFGISIVEAMWASKPVLAYRKGGPEETVRDGETGWLVQAATIKGYRRALDRSWRERDSWAELGSNGKQRCAQYSIDLQISNYIRLLGC